MTAPNPPWDFRREGRRWKGPEAFARFDLTAEKTEMHEGQLYWSDEDRLNMLCLLLENVGIDRVVRLGDPDVWRQAIEDLR